MLPMNNSIFQEALPRLRANRRIVRKAVEPFVIPEGYMTGDEFAKKVIEELKTLYEQHGLI